jgi:hypothetical protein
MNLTELFPAQGANAMNWVAYLLVVASALVYGLILNLLYQLYYLRNEPQDSSLGRSLVLMAPAVTTTFWLVQFSLPLSVGVIGALSFVRFRTIVKRPEDIVFILVLLSGCVGCALERFPIPLVLLILTAGYVLARNKFNGLLDAFGNFAIVTLNTREKVEVGEVLGKLRAVAPFGSVVSSRTYDGIRSIVFNVPRLKPEKSTALVSVLTGIDAQARVDVFYPNDRLGVG